MATYRVTVFCDRCLQAVEGMYDTNAKKSAAYHDVSGEVKDNPLAAYRKNAEKCVCNKCLPLNKTTVASK